ncbi:GNAT family N-acetyltransferase [Ruminococcus flavefaciens]|uniref:N-acetyltransferase domain-containing protein n=1 Tax=Ruminococcus flavefaciens 007c TaxID=1341157 RepID=W7UL24_RUMFL|nr:GNAT family N-acetyltransferase [Ruminococcus flavefaciens]EWM52279.1 hypothetical protein RF007C_13075 [Ruminococcus flavefaciens 007c]
MTVQLKQVFRDDRDKEILDLINNKAFPANERNSLDDLYDSGSDGNLDMLGIYADHTPVGFFTVRKYRNIRYLAYFAVSSDMRSKGIGSRALKLLTEFYPDTQIVTEFEAPDESCGNNSVRLHRRDFYLRNGFIETGWYSFYDETEFSIACSEPDFDKEGFVRFTEYLRTIVPDHIPRLYRK